MKNQIRFSMVSLWLLVALLAMLLAFSVACRDSTDTDSDDDDDDLDDDVDDDDDEQPPDTTPPDPPLVDPVLSPTHLGLQTITGLAEAGSRVEITGGLADANTVVEVDGSWCVTVYLDPLSTNTLAVTATDAAENVSDPTIAQIEQIENDDPTNQAFEKAATSSSTSSGSPQNSPDKAVDGDAGTRWDSSENHLNPQWLKVYLDDYIQIEQLKIVWNSDERAFADEYEIRVNPDRYAATEPVEDDWVTVYVETNGQGGTEEFDLPTPFGGWWVAILLQHSDSAFPLYNEYEIIEFEAWGYPYTEPDEGCY
ncbi:MAG: discoidin domain-containing protein [Candidatus Alcyoniella australis]|nr:discoidin domain-containing protein [Candidatus Alcyoniella australis]